MKLVRRAALAIAGVLALGACSSAPTPNFVIVLCDNLGYGDIEPFGSKLHRTPNLNRMAREGRKLTHFYSTSGVCTPSRASLLTGCYAQRIGLHRNPRDEHVLRPVSPYGLHPDEVTIAELLQERGYATAIIGKWHLGDQPAFLPTRHGFDSYFGIPYSDDMTEDLGRRSTRFGEPWPPLPLMEDERVVEAPVDRNPLTKRYTERAVQFIEEHSDGPFFLYLPHAMPGSTRAPFASESFRGRSRNGPWGDAVEELDWSIGQILDKLVELGIDRRTFVLWTSDNGAPLAPDLGDPSRGSNLPLHGRGYTTAEGGFRIPGIAWWPGTIPPESSTDELLTTMELLPTLAGWAGAAVPTDRVIDGMDAGSVLIGEAGALSPRQDLYYYQQDQLQAVRSGPWKLFLALNDSYARHPHFATGEGPEPLLFNLMEDIACERNVARDHPEIVERLLRIAAKARADLGDRGSPGDRVRPLGQVDNPKAAVLMP